MPLDPRLLTHFLAVARHGSINRAAVSLRLSQPALSNSIAALERTLGVPVLIRNRQGSTLTEYGKMIARHADAVDSHIQTLIEEVRAKAAGGVGSLQIGVTPIAASTVLPKAIAQLMSKMPGLTVSVMEAPDDRLLDLLLKGQIELFICPVGMEAVPSQIVEHELLSDPFAVIVRKGHRLAKSKTVSVADIIDEQWILPHKGSAFRRQIEAIFLTSGFAVPVDSINSNSRGMIEQLLLLTDRVAIMSDLFIRGTDPKSYARIGLRYAGAARTIGFQRLANIALSSQATLLITIVNELLRVELLHKSGKPFGRRYNRG